MEALSNSVTSIYYSINHSCNHRSYARNRDKHYDLFGSQKPRDEGFQETWKKEMDEDSCLWTGSEDKSDDENSSDKGKNQLEKDIRKAKEHSDLIDADDSDELRSVWFGSDEEKTLWIGDECDDEDDIPTEAHPNEANDRYLDELFEFEEKTKYRTISELMNTENEPEELSPRKQAGNLQLRMPLRN
ncbi:hypothetical protein SADUNF_Sadunf04G0063900 [Salix dunnii]|uniref:Uncharacterized protein n=1 Tax=Salix dunnii TaxID=1413687 RepID=A0A835N3X4_9ROSI|nr:hypothetical protein SADUNF_Sadunf04G0063900 [Salix dunnii]